MAAGSTARVYPEKQLVHFLRKTITYEDGAVEVGEIPAGSVIVKPASGVNVSTAFNDSGTDLLDIGVSGNNDLYATNLDVSSAGFLALDESVSTYVSSDTVITAEYAGQNGNASAGEAQVVICYIPNIDG